MIHAQKFIGSYENPTKNIDDDSNMQTRYNKNVQIYMCSIYAVIICERQGIAVRIHRDNLYDRFLEIAISLQS